MQSEFIEKPRVIIARLHGSEKTESQYNNLEYSPLPISGDNDVCIHFFGSEKKIFEDPEEQIISVPEIAKSESIDSEEFEYFEDDDSNGSGKKNGIISKKRLRRCLKLAIVIVLAAFVPKALSDIYHSSSRAGTNNRFIDETGIDTLSPKTTCQEINTPEDFLSSWNRVSCVEIVEGYGLVSSLTEPTAADQEVTEEIVRKRLAKADTVQRLDVDARISEKWLGLLLTELKGLKSVRLRINGLCEGACVKERNSLPHLELPHVTDLILDSDSHWCDIITWVFKYKVPQLKSLTLKNVKFSGKTFNALVRFLKSDGKQLESVVLQSCTLCRFGCDLDSVPEDVRGKLGFLN